MKRTAPATCCVQQNYLKQSTVCLSHKLKQRHIPNIWNKRRFHEADITSPRNNNRGCGKMQDTVGLSQYQLAYFACSAHLDSPLPAFFFLSHSFSHRDQPPDWNQVTLTSGLKTYKAARHMAVLKLKDAANAGSNRRSCKSGIFLSLFIQSQWFMVIIPDTFSNNFYFLIWNYGLQGKTQCDKTVTQLAGFGTLPKYGHMQYSSPGRRGTLG